MALARPSETVVCSWALALVGVGVLQLQVTFDLYHSPPFLTLANPNSSLLVNEFEDPGAISGREDSLSACGVTPPSQEVGRAIVLEVWWKDVF